MDTIHIINIEKYQPAYKDGRRLLWIRWDIDSLKDYKIHKLSISQRWLYICLICLETHAQEPVPYDEEYLCHQIDYPKSSIHKDLLMLQTIGLVVTSCNNDFKSSSPTDRQTDNTDRQKKGFAPPSLEEVSKYCLERNNSIKPQDFIDFYAARDWKFKGGIKMKDWRAAVRTWEKNQKTEEKPKKVEYWKEPDYMKEYV